MEEEEEEEEGVLEKVKYLFENVDLNGVNDVMCTADCPIRLKHYIHKEESTLGEALQNGYKK